MIENETQGTRKGIHKEGAYRFYGESERTVAIRALGGTKRLLEWIEWRCLVMKFV